MNNHVQFLKAVLLSRFGINTPLKVQHNVTFRCNLRCKYCGLWRREFDEMTTEEIKRCMDAFREMGTIAWGFTGGESLSRDDMGELIGYARSLGFIASMVTNGVLIDDRIKNLNMLIVSLDGCEEVTDSIRGKGVFQKALDGIKFAKKSNVPVYIQTVLSRANLSDDCKGLIELLNLAEELNCRLMIQPIHYDDYNKDNEGMKELQIEGHSRRDAESTGRGEDEGAGTSGVSPAFSYRRDAEGTGLQKAFDLIEKAKKRGLIFYSSVGKVSGKMPDTFPIYDLRPTNLQRRCYAGRLFCNILPDGSVTACHFKDHISFRKGDFKESFRALASFDDCACYTASNTYYNALFSLELEALFATLYHKP